MPRRSARHLAVPIPVVVAPAVHHHRGGFLGIKRRYLALGALAASTVMMSIPALPASARIVETEITVPIHQTFTAPAGPELAVVRDGFVMTEYSMVQWPVPVSTTMSSSFGFRSCAGCSSDHKGIDLNPGNGYPVQAIADGTVIEAIESDEGLGVHLIVEHVIDGQVVHSVYGHMQFGSLTVAVGDTVSIGQQIGVVGSTGQSTGPHLHFEIRIDDVQIDPLPWLMANANS